MKKNTRKSIRPVSSNIEAPHVRALIGSKYSFLFDFRASRIKVEQDNFSEQGVTEENNISRISSTFTLEISTTRTTHPPLSYTSHRDHVSTSHHDGLDQARRTRPERKGG